MPQQKCLLDVGEGITRQQEFIFLRSLPLTMGKIDSKNYIGKAPDDSQLLHILWFSGCLVCVLMKLLQHFHWLKLTQQGWETETCYWNQDTENPTDFL